MFALCLQQTNARKPLNKSCTFSCRRRKNKKEKAHSQPLSYKHYAPTQHNDFPLATSIHGSSSIVACLPACLPAYINNNNNNDNKVDETGVSTAHNSHHIILNDYRQMHVRVLVFAYRTANIIQNSNTQKQPTDIHPNYNYYCNCNYFHYHCNYLHSSFFPIVNIC